MAKRKPKSTNANLNRQLNRMKSSPGSRTKVDTSKVPTIRQGLFGPKIKLKGKKKK